MDIKGYAANSRLPLKTLRWMVAQEIISDPLTDNELIGLELLKKLWGKMDFVRPQLRQMNKKNRKPFIETCKFDTKWERSAYSRMMNIESGERLSMKKLIRDIEVTFLFELSIFQIKRLYQIREIAYKARKKQNQNPQNDDTKKSNNDPDKSEFVSTK
ncbi:MAG: hypothetical protein ABIJ50_13690 [Pseudomonadota bacterium]